MDLPPAMSGETNRSIAGNVAPMEKVAGSSTKNGIENAAAQCRAAEGVNPIRCEAKSFAAGSRPASSNPHIPIINSSAAYHRPGRKLRLITPSRVQAPKATPPKNAATTASTAGIS